jgi:HEAT repeat protein
MRLPSSLGRSLKRRENAQPVRLRRPLGALLVSTLCLLACDRAPERVSRAAVRQVVAANTFSEQEALARVARIGSFALPDIEEELHGAPTRGRLRLLEAIGQIGDPAAEPLVRLVAHRDEEASVREKAKEVLRELSAR